ncbi:MAG: hypothetical protein H6739_34445 [Alphaproteobacteria bacterium]|nr:hypothetical protein [Alphaproteobacteria bacterium]
MLIHPRREFPDTLLVFTGTAISRIWPLLLVIFVLSLGMTLQYEAWHLDRFTLTLVPFTLSGLALSIFLGFRNNACYDRWWEARKLWGALINTTRSLARLTLSLIGPDDGDPERIAFKEAVVHRIIAYAYALRDHLRQDPRWDDLAPWLPPDELAALQGARNAPVMLLHTLSRLYRDAWARGLVHDLHLPTLEEQITALTNIQGGCERIKNTPVPLSYTVLTHRIVGLYCFALPFGIVGQVGDLTPAVAVFISFAFLGLDSVGTQLEDPFEIDPNDLPLDAMCRVIEVSLLQTLGDTELPPDVAPVGGILT